MQQLGAPLGRTMMLGLLAAIPTALVDGPLLAHFTVHHVRPINSVIDKASTEGHATP